MKLLLLILLPLLADGCGTTEARSGQHEAVLPDPLPENKLASIPLPEGYHYESAATGSFAAFLRNLPLKKDNRVYLYNGRLKANQRAQYAVLDISVGDKDLQQCADAVMRLRAEWLYQQKKYKEIQFTTVSGTQLNFADWKNGQRFRLIGNTLKPIRVAKAADLRQSFDRYLEFVFSYCGTASLPVSLRKKSLQAIRAGDVFLEPGSPGHAVLVMATARNSQGRRCYLLAQSYMPAQSIHLLLNPTAQGRSPWYAVTGTAEIITPEWIFTAGDLYEWRTNP